MDWKVADLRKKLNKLKHESRIKTDMIARLMKDYEKVVHMNAEMVSYIINRKISNRYINNIMSKNKAVIPMSVYQSTYFYTLVEVGIS